MNGKILKYWKDPVWSKVISVIILAFITVIYNYIISLITQTVFLSQMKDFFYIKIDLWIFIILFLMIYITYSIFNFVKSKQNRDFLYDIQTLNLDRNLFDKIRNNYIDVEAVKSLAYNSFSSRPFGCKELEFMENIILECINPNFEFVNPNIEQLKLDFVNSIVDLKDYVDKNTFSTNGPPDSDDIWLRVPREWDIDKTREVYSKIKELENNAYQKWKEFIRKGRIILKI